MNKARFLSLLAARRGFGGRRDSWVCAKSYPAGFMSNPIWSGGRRGGWVCVEFIQFVSSATRWWVGLLGRGSWVWCGLWSWIGSSKACSGGVWFCHLEIGNWELGFDFSSSVFFLVQCNPIGLFRLIRIKSDQIWKQIRIWSDAHPYKNQSFHNNKRKNTWVRLMYLSLISCQWIRKIWLIFYSYVLNSRRVSLNELVLSYMRVKIYDR